VIVRTAEGAKPLVVEGQARSLHIAASSAARLASVAERGKKCGVAGCDRVGPPGLSRDTHRRPPPTAPMAGQ
jgi:hypothetical protein